MDTEVGKMLGNSKKKKKDRILCITVMRVEMCGFECPHTGTGNNLKSEAFFFFF